MTKSCWSGWMKLNKIPSYEDYYTDNSGADNQSDVEEEIEKKGLLTRDEILRAFEEKREDLLEKLYIYLHYHIVDELTNIVGDEDGDFVTHIKEC